MDDMKKEKCCCNGVRCISWSAIFVGALVAVGLGFLLNLFSVAIGLSAFSTSPTGTDVFAMGGYLGLIIGVVISMFVAGMVAGCLARNYCQCGLGALYGFITWVVALIFLIILAVPVAKYVSMSTLMLNAHAVMIRGPMEGMAVIAPTPQAAHNMAQTTFALFALFFLAAISSCLGGHYGMKGCPSTRKDDFRSNM